MIFAKKSWGFTNFPKASLHPLIFKYIKLFSFEAYLVIILVDFSLLQLLTGITRSVPHFSIILQVIREVLPYPFHLGKILHLFPRFSVSFCNQVARYLRCVVREGIDVARECTDVYIERVRSMKPDTPTETHFNEWTVYQCMLSWNDAFHPPLLYICNFGVDDKSYWDKRTLCSRKKNNS